ncbi:hypothetical protein M0811_07145 [Anaeramoeba ignava]|uniref:Uncharacterized protein n=1 Tax=Anaeramoeba ignava TaxID=1746090 RepID=A0A9Q0LQT2_ANAIG|nr:hypothetical protein M0811_07145 [Anaeramoeba ignava]
MEQERKNFINQLLALRKTRKLNSKPEKAVFIYEESKKQNFPLSINFISQELNISSSQIKRALKAKREGREIGQKLKNWKQNEERYQKKKFHVSFAIVRNLLEKMDSYQPSLIINADETIVKLGNKTKVQVVTSKRKNL